MNEVPSPTSLSDFPDLIKAADDLIDAIYSLDCSLVNLAAALIALGDSRSFVVLARALHDEVVSGGSA